MNANELADWLETGEVEEYDINEAATMLRQQQAEIEALKKEVYWAKDQWNKDRICFEATKNALEKKLDTRTRELIGASFYEHDYKTMMSNNEPVAYEITNGKTKWLAFDPLVAKEPDEVAIPLYTHPVKELTETDLILILEVLIDSYDDTNRGFLEYEAMYKNSPMRKARIDGMKRMVDKHTHAIEMVEAILRKAQENDIL